MSDELIRLRGLLGISKSALDRRAGVPQGTTHDIESRRNKNPSHETVTLLTRALQRSGLMGVTAEQVFPVAIVDSQSDSTVSTDPVTTGDLSEVP